MGRKGKMLKPGDRRAGRMEGSSAPGQDLAMPVSTANAGLEASEGDFQVPHLALSPTLRPLKGQSPGDAPSRLGGDRRSKPPG